MLAFGKKTLAALAGAGAIFAGTIPAAAMPIQNQAGAQMSQVTAVAWRCNSNRECWEVPDTRGGFSIQIGPGGVQVGPDYMPPPPRRYLKQRHYKRDYDRDRRYGHSRYSRHIEWCLDRYRSYDPRSDTFVTYGGTRRYCNSPYD